MKHTKALWGILFVSMFAVSVSGTAFAEEMADGEAPADDGKGIYGGFQAGGSLWDEGDDSSFGWRANVWAHPFAYLGVEQLANFVSLEVAFVDLGKITPGSDSTLGNGGQADAGEDIAGDRSLSKFVCSAALDDGPIHPEEIIGVGAVSWAHLAAHDDGLCATGDGGKTQGQGQIHLQTQCIGGGRRGFRGRESERG